MLLEISKTIIFASLPLLVLFGLLGTKKEVFLLFFESVSVLFAMSVIFYVMYTQFFFFI